MPEVERSGTRGRELRPSATTVADWGRASDEELAACPEVPTCREILLRRYEQKIRACARRMSCDRIESEDLAQQTFVRVLEALPRYAGRSSFNTWLTRIAKNTCIDEFRRGRTRQGRHLEPGDPERFWADRPASGPPPSEAVLDGARACHLDQAIADLPRDQRRVTELTLVEGLPQGEVAERLGLTVEAVKGRLKRARVRLRRRLNEPTVCPLCARLGGFRVGPRGELE